MEYNFKKIEAKWQKKWEKEKLYGVKEDPRKDKFYCLIEFPYPSGEGLHVGHPRSYTALDIVARKHRMQGQNVLYPIGWDAFGLPTENYAIKTGIQPAVATAKNIKNFTRQLKSLGLSFDWSREVNTTDPGYYKWTQWMFVQFFKHSLAYKNKIAINWCTKCKIGLANEEVVNGRCERCGGPVEKRMKEQWMLKITKYAERLLEGLKKVDYSPRIKEGQINWIGKSEGAEVEFGINNSELKIKVFTTRPDTLFGATYMVLAPEHEMVEKLKSKITNWDEVEKYIGEAKRKSDLERTELQKEKTGVELKGIKAINPVNNEEISIWVADYVLTGYGTGAIMAVPAHDERDFAFAKKFGLPIKTVVAIPPDKKIDGAERRDGAAALILDSENKILVMYDKMLDKYNFPRGGTEKGETPQEAALREAREETGYINLELVDDLGCKDSYFYAADKKVNRHRLLCGFSFRLTDEKRQEVHKDDLGRYDLLWMSIEEAQKKLHFGEDKIFIATLLDPKRICFAGEGTAVNSDFLDGLSTAEAKEKITKWLEEKHIGKKAVNYKLRDWVFSRQRYWGEPIPLVYCEQCAKDKPKFLFFHAFKATSKSDFWPWLKNELESRGFEVAAPDLPNPYKPNFEEQEKFVLDNFVIDDKTIIVTHSLGGVLAMEMLGSGKLKARKLVMLAPPLVPKFTDKKRPEVENFCDWKFDFAKIKKAVKEIMVLADKNDDCLFPEHPRELAAKLDAKFMEVVAPGTHFNCPEAPVILDNLLTGDVLNPGWVPVEEKDLPVELPKVKKYEPTDTGESPLAAMEKWVKTKCPKCGGEARRETDTMPNWAGSSWYFLRYTDPKNKKEFAGGKNLKYWLTACPAGQNKCNEIGGVDWYNGGMEHNNLHLLYSRFWYKFLYDIGEIPKECGDEPYKKRTSHGLILGEGGEKMSKSRGNVVNPDDIVARFGADTLRVYEMFMGPFEQAIPWDEKGVVGVFRFLERVWKLSDKVVSGENKISSETERILHKTIKKVGEDIEQMKFNTAVSALMILTNALADEKVIGREAWRDFLKTLAPFAPHLAEELWEKLGNKKSVHLEKWPEYDPKLVVEEEIDLVVQVNGKVRDTIRVKSDIDEEEAKKIATESEKTKKWTEGKEIKKIIFVRGRLVNIVV